MKNVIAIALTAFILGIFGYSSFKTAERDYIRSNPVQVEKYVVAVWVGVYEWDRKIVLDALPDGFTSSFRAVEKRCDEYYPHENLTSMYIDVGSKIYCNGDEIYVEVYKGKYYKFDFSCPLAYHE